jgi:hypothetical protein
VIEPLTAQEPQTDVQQFLRASLRAILRAEDQDRLPARFTGTGQEIWRIFRNELDAADLAALAVQDAGAAMPVPFDPRRWWPEWPDWVLFRQPADEAEGWIAEARDHAGLDRDGYLRRQAALLEIDLPTPDQIAALPTPKPHERWLELPGTGGWLAYALCQRPEANLYLWENFTIVCDTPQEMLLAGLIAYELNAPPRTPLPIRLDESGLVETLESGGTYHAVVGRRDLHGHRDLRILLREGKEPLWV